MGKLMPIKNDIFVDDSIYDDELNNYHKEIEDLRLETKKNITSLTESYNNKYKSIIEDYDSTLIEIKERLIKSKEMLEAKDILYKENLPIIESSYHNNKNNIIDEFNKNKKIFENINKDNCLKEENKINEEKESLKVKIENEYSLLKKELDLKLNSLIQREKKSIEDLDNNFTKSKKEIEDAYN